MQKIIVVFFLILLIQGCGKQDKDYIEICANQKTSSYWNSRADQFKNEALKWITRKILAKDKYEEDLGDVVKATKEQARKIKHQAELQMQTALEHEKKLREEMKKISQAIEKQMYQEKKSILATSKSLFQKAVQGNERRTKLHIVGKKN